MSKDSVLTSLDNKINLLVGKFAPDQRAIDKPAIISWLKQFSEKDIKLAVKILENVRYCDPQFIIHGCRNIRSQFITCKAKNYHEFYCGLGSIGHSGNALVRPFRIANNLRKNQYDSRFKTISDLNKLPKNSAVLLIEDIIGSGDQVSTYAQNLNDLMIPEEINLFLGVMLASDDAIKEIEKETNFTVISHITLRERDNIFSPKSLIFTTQEKSIIKKYCEKTKIRDFLGHKNGGLLVVFSDSTPNNTIGIIRSNNSSFRGLLPRDEYNT
jgi:hypothetical protein